MARWKTVYEDVTVKAQAKVNEDGTAQAKVHMEDEGERGKNVVLSGETVPELVNQLNDLANAFTQTAARVTELAPPAPEQLQF